MTVETAQGDSAEQVAETIRRAGEVFAAGGLVVFPTETVYGLGASAKNDRGFEALREFKGRQDQPFTLHIPRPLDAARYIDATSPRVVRLIKKVFPGPVTLIVEVTDAVIEARLGELGMPLSQRERIYYRNTVGLRCPDHALGQRVLGSVEDPIVASSANRRSESPPSDVDEATRAVGEAAGLVVDGGSCRYAKPSTIVRVRNTESGPAFTVEREGVYDERYIRKLLRWNMLLVCSGNTCRSPMAEGLARQLIAQRYKIAPEDLELAGYRVTSAGAFAAAGTPPSPEAVEAMAKVGVDISRHRSRMLTLELVNEADVIYCMTRTHQEAVIDLSSAAADKTFMLDPGGDVEDPMGSGPTAYQRSAEVIRRRLEQRLKEQLS